MADIAHPDREATVDDVAAIFAAQGSDETVTPEEPQVEAEAEIEDETTEIEPVEAGETGDEETDDEESAEEEQAFEVEEIAPSQAPISWTAEEKAEFDQLPPDIQRAVVRRESQRDTDFHTKTTDLAEQRRQFDEAVKMAQTQLVERLTAADALHAQALETFGIGQEPDWDKLRAELDRDDYRDVRDRWEDNQRQLAAFNAKRAEAQQQLQAEQQANQQTYIRAQIAKTEAEWAEYADPSTRQAALDDLFGFLHGQGLTSDQTSQLIDANFIRIARMAKAYDALQKSKPLVKTKVKKAPKVVKPGAARNRSTNKAERVRTAMQRAKAAEGGHGQISALANLFSEMRQKE